MTIPHADRVLHALIETGRLERLSAAASDGEHHLASARAVLASAQRELHHNPETAYVLAYDAARRAAAGVLAQHGLRARGGAHHVTTAEAVVALHGSPYEYLDTMRARRNQMEYPLMPGAGPDYEEGEEALRWAASIVEAAAQEMPAIERYPRF